ncbi:MAG: serine/threonine-protein kinase, partial [Myxococcota bacterium]
MDRLGRFVLTRFLGRGGMGEVWQGHHLVDQTPVAIKLVDGPLAGRRQSISAEIRAISALDHPHIIWIYDQGVVDGRPYFAMELAEGGNLVESPPTDWLSLRDVLVQLLSALSHAHARGVLHRDIKPENVLCGGARPGIKLADFGLGVFFQDDDRAGLGSGGTPAYMAPEQFEQQRASFGPWTDLYALGCMTYALAAGQRPFPERDFAGLRAAHLHRTIPPLRPRFPVPPTLEAWIRRAMMRAIQERFANAAEAAAALPDNSILSASMVSIRDIALTEQATNTDPGRADDQPVSADVPEAVQPLPRPRPLAAPEDWRQPPRTSLRLMGAGLSLFGLRALPLIGREKERDLLWAALRKGLQGDSFPIVFIEGAAGVGKSRLARWLCDTAAELGLSQPIRAEHSRAGAPGDGLPGALCRAIGLSRDTLTVPELQRRLEGLWPPDSPGWRALCALLHRQPDRSSPREQQVLQAQVLRFLSPRTLLWIDDGQWATDSLGFLRRLAEDPTALNGMAVVTLRSETLPEER